VTNSNTDARAALRGLRPYRGVWPRVEDGVWVAENALVIGDVVLGADVSVWYGCVLRGDSNSIRVGARTNIQDGSILHVTADLYPCTLGEEVTVGHRAVVHGCTVGDGALIGIGAVVLDGAHVGHEATVGAGAVVPPGAEVPDGMLAVGIPARVVRALRPEEREAGQKRARSYMKFARHHAEEDS
jgi:carbonic anhydrase/acetyltransferase-like protein (isoleucine patch superfamily)